MKIIEVCEGYSSAGAIKRYQNEHNINNLIIPLALFLSIGDIKNNREKFLKKLYPEIDFKSSNEDFLNELFNNIDADTKIRIWSSKKNDDDYLLVLYICNLLKDKCYNISVIYTSDYNEYADTLGAIDYKEVKGLLKYEKTLSKMEIEKFSNEWINLVDANSELRVLKNEKIENKKYSDYDDIILNHLKELGECTIANLVARLMINFTINSSSDVVYLYLIDRLIESKKIIITKNGERHFVDTIKINCI